MVANFINSVNNTRLPCYKSGDTPNNYINNLLLSENLQFTLSQWKIDLLDTIHVQLATCTYLFSNRSQMTSKCDKNTKVTHEGKTGVLLLFLPYFDVYVICNSTEP